ncbi:MAG: electron transfer flavoprotein subunit beta/FixA family protein [Proteobacteria bacterium]|nr:electron transfer flavoprotein subunit beta/FixA family protein [Pseudomonadota bacterium]
MKILVLVKQTPDTATKVKISADSKSIDQTDTKFIINPYDEFAIEEALKLKTKIGTGEVVVASFGDESAKEFIVKGLAMGGDRGLWISNAGFENADGLVVSKIIAAAIKAENANIVFCGKQAIDDDNMHVQTMTAELLGWPHVNVITKFDINGTVARVEREVEGGQVEIYDVQLPAIFGAHKSLNTPRYASLPGIRNASKKPFDSKKPADYGVSSMAPKTTIKGFKYPPEKPKGKLFQGEPVDVMVDKVVKLLREEAKAL